MFYSGMFAISLKVPAVRILPVSALPDGWMDGIMDGWIDYNKYGNEVSMRRVDSDRRKDLGKSSLA